MQQALQRREARLQLLEEKNQTLHQIISNLLVGRATTAEEEEHDFNYFCTTFKPYANTNTTLPEPSLRNDDFYNNQHWKEEEDFSKEEEVDFFPTKGGRDGMISTPGAQFVAELSQVLELNVGHYGVLASIMDRDLRRQRLHSSRSSSSGAY